jgi:hypothetical protein
MPASNVKGPTVGENPLAVTSAETNPPFAAPTLLSITMSPLRVHVGEQAPPTSGIMAADTSRVMIPALAGLLSASPAMIAASVVLRNVENIVSPMIVVLSGRRSFVSGILPPDLRSIKQLAAAFRRRRRGTSPGHHQADDVQ